MYLSNIYISNMSVCEWGRYIFLHRPPSILPLPPGLCTIPIASTSSTKTRPTGSDRNARTHFTRDHPSLPTRGDKTGGTRTHTTSQMGAQEPRRQTPGAGCCPTGWRGTTVSSRKRIEVVWCEIHGSLVCPIESISMFLNGWCLCFWHTFTTSVHVHSGFHHVSFVYENLVGHLSLFCQFKKGQNSKNLPFFCAGCVGFLGHAEDMVFINR